MVGEGFRNDILGNSGCVAFSKDNSNAEYLYPIILPLRSDGVVVSATVASKAVCQLRGIPCGGFRGHFSASS